MGNNRILLAGLVGAVTLFILGAIVYGMLLMQFMADNAGATGVNKTEEEMSFGWIIISNLAAGFLLAVIYGKYSSIRTAMAGAQADALIGFLMALSVDAAMFATTHVYSMTAMWVDIIAWTVMCSIASAVVAATLGMKSKVAAAA